MYSFNILKIIWYDKLYGQISLYNVVSNVVPGPLILFEV